MINFVVVTKGAERISEVSARFTLDALPGKQMAIDADLNAGLINQEQARVRRQDVANERTSTARWTVPPSLCAVTPSPAS
jgi:Flagellar biosynthesis pathway, component FlhA